MSIPDMINTHFKKRILITGGRSAVALDLSRHFVKTNCEVYLADSMPIIVSRFSNTIKKSFLIPAPRYAKHAFIEAIINIIKEYRIDLLIPTFEETLYIAQYHSLHPITDCTIFCSSFNVLHRLHHKWLFQNYLAESGFLTIPTTIIKSYDELKQLNFPKPYIIKACYSRASLKFFKIDNDTTIPPIHITPQNPWIIEPWLDGKRYCSYSICHNGILAAHSVYPVKIAINGNSCILFESLEHPQILNWVMRFIEKEKFTGQISFDFIETGNHQLYAIECNPRATSGIHLFVENDNLATAFLNINDKLITPQSGIRRQIALGMLLYGWQSNACESFLYFLKSFFSTADVIFDRKDLKPFFMQPLVFIQLLRLAKRLNLSLPAVFNHDLEWNG